ncbi:MAG: hypothetical protein Alpg2KO_20790 [Alphaproteobacteria bacterium]
MNFTRSTTQISLQYATALLLIATASISFFVLLEQSGQFEQRIEAEQFPLAAEAVRTASAAAIKVDWCARTLAADDPLTAKEMTRSFAASSPYHQLIKSARTITDPPPMASSHEARTNLSLIRLITDRMELDLDYGADALQTLQTHVETHRSSGLTLQLVLDKNPESSHTAIRILVWLVALDALFAKYLSALTASTEEIWGDSLPKADWKPHDGLRSKLGQSIIAQFDTAFDKADLSIDEIDDAIARAQEQISPSTTPLQIFAMFDRGEIIRPRSDLAWRILGHG